MQEIKTLLMVEDDENDILISTRKIRLSGVKIGNLIITRNLSETLELLRKIKDVDIVLLDLNLEDSKGLDTLEAVIRLFHGVIIVLTSIDDTHIGINAIKMGADDFLVKGELNEKELERSVMFALQRREVRAAGKRLAHTLDKIDEALAKQGV